jgi:cellulose synthase/poly-beta-1,6-N-acetylglucosamine synthase-like glycosyltransferase
MLSMLIGWVSLLVLGVVSFLAIPAWVFWRQVHAARQVPPALPPTSADDAPREPVAVLIPAHNEAAVIRATLASVMPQLRPGDVVLVVADNCSDDTAVLARACGAQVTERQDTVRRGKGFALAHGVAVLRAMPTPPRWVVFVDADCTVHPHALDRLAHACQQTQQPVQALYLMQQPPAEPGRPHGWRPHLAEFAWRVRNWVRPLGGQRLGWPCHLMGAGMAFPISLLDDKLLANGHITEDMKLGIDLVRSGHPPRFLPSARVTSTFPTTQAATRTQRTRWEHGHLDMLLHQAPSLWRQGWQQRDPMMRGMALDLCVPPLALLTALLAFGWCLAVATWLLGGWWLPAVVATASLIGLVTAVTRAWQGWGRDVMAGRELLMVPLFILAKVPVYVGFVIRRQKSWVRTDRS